MARTPWQTQITFGPPPPEKIPDPRMACAQNHDSQKFASNCFVGHLSGNLQFHNKKNSDVKLQLILLYKCNLWSNHNIMKYILDNEIIIHSCMAFFWNFLYVQKFIYIFITPNLVCLQL